MTSQEESTNQETGWTWTAEKLSARIGAWTADLAEAAKSFGLPEVTVLCADVDAERHRRSFRVAVVGEFNRGKSTIVNQLLGVGVLPVGPLALTEGLVTVRGSSSSCIEVVRADGQQSRLPLSLDSWSAVSRGNQVTVWVDSAWLRDGGIELVDTAGTNNTGEDPHGEARRAVRRADAAIMCVSAIQPLAESERQFLAAELLRRRIPHLVVALTMADRIDDEARREVVSRLVSNLEAFGKPELVVSPGVDAAAAAVLKQILTEMATRTGRALSRSPFSRRLCSTPPRYARLQPKPVRRCVSERRRRQTAFSTPCARTRLVPARSGTPCWPTSRCADVDCLARCYKPCPRRAMTSSTGTCLSCG